MPVTSCEVLCAKCTAFGDVGEVGDEDAVFVGCRSTIFTGRMYSFPRETVIVPVLAGCPGWWMTNLARLHVQRGGDPLM